MKKGIACILALMMLLSATAFAEVEYKSPYNLKETTASTKVIFNAETNAYTWTLPDSLRYMELDNRVTGDNPANLTDAAELAKLHTWGDITVEGFILGSKLVIGVSSKRDFKLTNTKPIVNDTSTLTQKYNYNLYAGLVGTNDQTKAEEVTGIKKVNNGTKLDTTKAILTDAQQGTVKFAETVYEIGTFTKDEVYENKVHVRLMYCITDGLQRGAIGDYKDTLTFYVYTVPEE